VASEFDGKFFPPPSCLHLINPRRFVDGNSKGGTESPSVANPTVLLEDPRACSNKTVMPANGLVDVATAGVDERERVLTAVCAKGLPRW
jgi:hypothetical protein